MSISDAINPEIKQPVGTPTSISIPAAGVDKPEPPVKDEILDAILSRIIPATNIEPRRKILIYSDPGAGKTVFASSAPKGLVHDTENGAASINNHPEYAAHTQVLPFVSLYQFEQLVQRMIEGNNDFDKFDTYVIDTLSNLHKKGLEDTTVRNAQAGGLTTTGELLKNQFVAETEDHTENNERIRRVVSKLNDLSATKNVIILCHAKKVERKDKSIIVSPDFSDKLTNAINALVDVVGYMYLKDENNVVNRYLQLRGSQNVIAKTRFQFHPNELVNPTWNDLFPS